MQKRITLNYLKKLKKNIKLFYPKKDGTSSELTKSIDLFSRYFAKCPEMCEASCRFSTRDEQQCLQNSDAEPEADRKCCGPAGPGGKMGPRGETGPRGCAGEPGDAGESGEPGEMGYPGVRGPRGNPGENGKKGNPGIKGERGDPGNPGYDGEPGETGPKGDPGYEGQWGSYGPPGPNTGSPGEIGEPGYKGSAGGQGQRGETGKPGISSKSAQVSPNDKDELFMTAVFDLLENDPDIQDIFHDATAGLSYKPFCNCMT